ncbi:TonB-dependent receptor [bacterium]|nr:TonB-dependent receptor [bacterium]MBU1993362.1 TonB-dependent receptor [bacterium]
MKNAKKLSLLLWLFSSLYAQDTLTLTPLSVTSTAIKTDELKSTDAVEIYTQDDIEKAHVQNVYEFLNSQTSVITLPSYGNPFTQLIDIHGFGTSNGNQNIVISINGRRLNNIDNVPQLLASISPSSISTIEIIKSSGIVTGGDGANGGVINIITKKNNNKELALYGGSYGAVGGSFYLGHSDENLSVCASGEAQKNGGIRTIDTQGNKDKNRLSTGTFNAAYTPIRELELRLGASFARADVIYGGTMTLDAYNENPTQLAGFASHQLLDTDTLNVGASYYLSDAFSFNVDANHEKKKSDYVPSWGPSYYDYNTFKTSLDYISESVAFSLGLDGFYGERTASANSTSKNNKAGFIMSEFYLDNSTLKAGYRFEDVAYRYTDATKDLNKNETLHGAELGYNYTLNKQNSFFANYAHSYQAPSIDNFFATDYSNWPIVSSSFNGFIEPMQAKSFTLGYNRITQTNKFKISAYYIDLKNEIYLHKPDFKNTNIDKSHKYGIDIYDKFLINEAWDITFNYNYVQAIIDEEKIDRGDFSGNTDDYSGNTLPGVSDHNIKATLRYLPTPHATIALTQIYRSQAYAADDFNNNFTQKQDAYRSTDISAAYAKNNYELFAKINNLFNQKNGLWIQDDAIYPVNFTTTAMAGFKLKY